MCLALAVPTTLTAQNAGKPYPCVSPSGDVVQNVNQLSRALLAFLAGEDAKKGPKSADIAACDAVTLEEAIADGGDELAAAMDAAPEEHLALLTNPPEAAPEAEQAVETESEQATSEADAAPEAETVVEAESEQPSAEAETATATEAESEEPSQDGADTTTVEAELEAAEPDASPESVEAEAAVPSEETPTEAETAASAEAETPPEAEVPVTQETAEEAPSEEAPTETAANEVTPTDEPEAKEVTEVAQDVAPAAEEVATQAGEAGGEQLTDTERQELAQARAEENEISAAAAVDEPGEVEAEVETQTVTVEDVRSSAEDFDTSVSGQQTTAAAKANKEKKGLSDFEKALLLGLGAAVVGTILNNGDQVVSNSGDRVVVERDGELRVLKNDDVLLRRPGAEVQTQSFNDGSTRTIVSYDDGSQIITVRSPEGTVLRRTLIRASDGSEVVLFDDTAAVDPVDFAQLPEVATIEERRDEVALDDQDGLRVALRKALYADVGRTFSLRQVREYKRVRALAPRIDLDALTFATGSAAIQPSQAEALSDLGFAISEIIIDNPGAVFLVEGHTDAVGSASYNLALSDRRAETVALALTEYFDVPPQNLITQGYGESDLKIPVLTDEQANRRAAVRNITDLLD